MKPAIATATLKELRDLWRAVGIGDSASADAANGFGEYLATLTDAEVRIVVAIALVGRMGYSWHHAKAKVDHLSRVAADAMVFGELCSDFEAGVESVGFAL